MITSNMVAAKTLCEISGWSLSNLRLQKILYFAHRRFLGETGNPLVKGPFMRYPRGPVVKEVHLRVREYGKGAIPENAFGALESLDKNSAEYKTMEKEFEKRKNHTSTKLVDDSHEPGGAWERCFDENKREIPTDYIRNEYSYFEAGR